MAGVARKMDRATVAKFGAGFVAGAALTAVVAWGGPFGPGAPEGEVAPPPPGPEAAAPSLGVGPAEARAAAPPAETARAGPAEEGAPDALPVPVAPPPPPTEIREIAVARGDTLMGLLTGAGIEAGEAHRAIEALAPVYDARRMRIGQTFVLELAPDGPVETPEDGAAPAAGAPDAASGEPAGPPPGALLSLVFRPSAEREIWLSRGAGGGFRADAVDRALERRDAFAEGRIDTSLYAAAAAEGLAPDVLARLIRLFSFDVDFQREIRAGDAFAVLYETHHDGTGAVARRGDIAWASMTLSGQTLEYARHEPGGGVPDYYDRDGKSVKKTLMRTPIDGARLSSGYGKRRHPILGYTKMHRGVDFAAPTGVPIVAAGDGVVESIGRNGGYGKYIRIRHNATYKTAYAHMSKYRRGLKRGSRVRQGQTIGYVGSTGSSTGPHLHYEVMVNGRQVNPMSVRLPAGDSLKGAALAALQAGWPALDERVAAARGRRVAESGAGPG